MFPIRGLTRLKWALGSFRSSLSFRLSFLQNQEGPNSSQRLSRGFTLIELIMVIVIISTVSIVAIPRFNSFPQNRAYAAVHKVLADVRFAQLYAIQTQSRTRVVFDGANESYQLDRETSPGTWVTMNDPVSGSNYQVNLDSGIYQDVLISQVNLNSGNNRVVFDSYGSPFRGTGVALTAPAFIELNSQYQLQIESETGKSALVIL